MRNEPQCEGKFKIHELSLPAPNSIPVTTLRVKFFQETMLAGPPFVKLKIP